MGFPGSSAGKESACNAGDSGTFMGWENPHKKVQATTTVFLRFLGGSAGTESACYAGNLGLIPGLGRSYGEGNDYPLQYSDLENSMDCIVHEVTESWTQVSDFTLS